MEDKIIYGSVVLLFAVSLAAAGGIGGGGLNLPVLLVIFEYGVKRSVTLSLCAVVGSTLAQTLINSNARHPLKHQRPLIYYDCVWVLLPAQICGSIIGGKLREMLPDVMIASISMSVLCFACYKTVLRMKKSLAEERLTHTRPVDAKSMSPKLRDIAISSNATVFRESEMVSVSASNNYRQESQSSVDVIEVESPMHEMQIQVGLTIPPPSHHDISQSVYVPQSPQDEPGAVPEYTFIEIPKTFLIRFGAAWVVYTILFCVHSTSVDRCSAGYWILFVLSFIPMLYTLHEGITNVIHCQAVPGYVLHGDLDLTKPYFLLFLRLV